MEYFHVVFTLPAEVARIAYWNKKAVYDLLFKASAETVTTIAADPKRLGARVGMTSVLHTWGSALTHHPHVHMIVPGGGLSPDGARWVPCRPGFFQHVRVLSRLFRRLFLEGLLALHRAGALVFFGDLAGLADAGAFAAWLAPFRKSEWVVYAKPPFGGPEAVLAYLSRYTHRVAISNSPPGQRGRRDGRLPLEGLPHQVRRPAKGDAARHGRVHPPVPDPRAARRLSPHPALRPARQRRSARPTSRGSVSCSGPTGPDRSRKRPTRSSRSPCASHAPAVAARCASSRCSVPVSNHSRGRHHRSGQHDATPVTLADPLPVLHQAPVDRRVRRATAILLIVVRTGPTAPRKSPTSGEHGSRRARHREPCACPQPQKSQPTALFPHRQHPAPRGFLLGRFSNAGRGRARPQPHATARIGKPSPRRTSASSALSRNELERK